MVAPVREVANIQISNSSASFQHFSMTHLPSNVDMDDVRGRSPLPSKLGSRDSSIDSSIFSTVSPKACHEHMEINNNLPDDNI